MDIKNKIDEVTAKLKGDDGMLEKFKANPVTALEELIGKDLPDEQVKQIVDGIKEKVDLGEIGGKVTGKLGDIGEKIGDAIGGIIGKKD